MKLNEPEIRQILQILTSAEDFRPIVHAAMQAIESYSEELKKYPRAIVIFDADLTCEIFDRYLSRGFNREEALLLTINQRMALKESIKKARETK